MKKKIYQQIDEQKDEAKTSSEDTLNQILPEAFAVVKETAKSFKEKETITVTATPYDREISQTKTYVQLKGRSMHLGKFLGCSWKTYYLGHGSL